MSGNLLKSVFFEAGVSLCAQISDGRGHRPPNSVGVRKLEWLLFCVVSKWQNIRSPSFSFVTIHASDRETDRRTHRIVTAIPCVALYAVAQ